MTRGWFSLAARQLLKEALLWKVVRISRLRLDESISRAQLHGVRREPWLVIAIMGLTLMETSAVTAWPTHMGNQCCVLQIALHMHRLISRQCQGQLVCSLSILQPHLTQGLKMTQNVSIRNISFWIKGTIWIFAPMNLSFEMRHVVWFSKTVMK